MRRTIPIWLSMALLFGLFTSAMPLAAAEEGRTDDGASPADSVSRSVYETVPNIVLHTADDSRVGVNLAVHKAVYASGSEVEWLGPANAVDGNGSTRWSSALQDDQWFYVDLGAAFTINRVVLKWQTPASKYKLYVSTDAEHWTNVLGGDAEIVCRGGTETVDFDDVQARYVKFQGVKRAPVDGIYYGYSFFEFEVYDAGDLPKIVKGITRIPPIAQGQTKIVLPDVPEGYTVSVYGSDRLPVIDREGNVHAPLVDTNVNLLFQVEKTNDPGQKGVTGNVPVFVPGRYTQTDDRNVEPKVVPSLREWYGRTGDFTLTPASRIVVEPADRDALRKAAEQTKEDLRDIANVDAAIVYGSPQPGDLYLSIDDTLGSLGHEGYVFDVDDHVAIASSDATGVFFGTRTALQILKQDGRHARIPKGTARDYPKYEMRGLMIDVARKFYTIDFLRQYVKLLSWYKMNHFQIHLNDDVGTPFLDGTTAAYRLESETYPGLASKNGFYTKAEFRDLQRLGADYGVNVVPEIDTPGHSRAFTAFDPSLGTGPHLDITRPKTVEFVKSLFDEYIDGDNPTFIGPDVHIGTDEYWGSDKEVFRGYMDTLIRHIDDKGKRPHLWGGMTEYNGTTPVSNRAAMNVWHVPYGDARQAIDLGYDIINTENSYMYLVPRLFKEYMDPKFMYEKWEPNVFSDTTLPYGHPKLKGAMIALWNDISDASGLSMDDSHDRLFPAVQVLSEKMWTGSREDADYNAYAAAAARIGEAPNANISRKLQVSNEDGSVIRYRFENGFADESGNGYAGEGKNVSVTDGKFGKGVRLNGGESYVQTPLEALGFGWTASMWVKPDADNPDDAVLLESPVGQVKLKQGTSGKLGFSKEHYHSTFQYEVPAERWTHLLLTGDNKGVSLYVNGNEYVEKLWVTNGATPRIDTLVLPIGKIGSATRSFKGVVDNVTVYNKAVSFDGNNLALNKRAESSANEAPHLSADQAVDGNAGTRWASAFADDQWFLVDLGGRQPINSVVIKWENAFAKTYKLYVSDDGEQWRNVKADDGAVEGKGGVETIAFAPTEARYVKLQGIERGTIYGYSIFEFEVYGQGVWGDYVELAREAEAMLASGQGDAGLRNRVQDMLDRFPYDYESSIGKLRELVVLLQESIDRENDKTPPVTTAAVTPPQPDGRNGWYVRPATVAMSAQDDRSGIGRTEYSADGGTSWRPYTGPIVLATDGVHDLLYRSADKAGNLEAAKSVLVRIDRTAPTIAATANGVPLTEGAGFLDGEPLVLEAQAADPASGVAGVAVTVDGQRYVPGTPLLLAGRLGAHEVRIEATDDAGNVSRTVISFTMRTSIASMERLSDVYFESGDISGSLRDKLSRSLDAAAKHERNGKLKQAATAMRDVVKRLDKADGSDAVSEAARTALLADANALIPAWTGGEAESEPDAASADAD
ncbi:discoidin domain-containing protein [Paenibacillus flagellatus]|uniref:Beta-N-acetylhexosaminidase n=1 Tax=Paenibacillus flagellatus TaxID=2211139 RepID=A0A2V5K2T4_9BACL|nr:discoidin domain-containing protein [Paenibacillus flagellatus]PYI51873.1 beta-N-acetylhexosaminidase [Paenibacillus flagellatus]